MDYICIKDCGFCFGDICSIVSQNDKYIVLENQDKEKNVFTEDEFNKWFKKLKIKDIKHCDKFEKLRDKLSDIDENEYFEIAKKEYNKQNYYLSIKYFNKNLESKYSNIMSLFNIGVNYFKLGKYNTSLEYLFKAKREFERNNYDTYNIIFNIGSCYYNLNNINEASKYFYKAKELNGNDKDLDRAIKILESKINK